MAHIRQINPESAEGRLKAFYDSTTRRSGGVAHIIKLMSLAPDVMRGSIQFYVTLMKSKNALPAQQRELLATVVSGFNDCYY